MTLISVLGFVLDCYYPTTRPFEYLDRGSYPETQSIRPLSHQKVLPNSYLSRVSGVSGVFGSYLIPALDVVVGVFRVCFGVE